MKKGVRMRMVVEEWKERTKSAQMYPNMSFVMKEKRIHLSL